MTVSRETAASFAEAYGSNWNAWDVAGFCALFSEDVNYIAHPTEETVVGRTALEAYVKKEQREQGSVRVRMGTPLVDGEHVVCEFWVAATDNSAEATIAGCLIAHLRLRTGCAASSASIGSTSTATRNLALAGAPERRSSPHWRRAR